MLDMILNFLLKILIWSAVFIAFGWMMYKLVFSQGIDKYPDSGSANVGQAILTEYMDADKKKSMKEIHYRKEIKREKEDAGDDIRRFTDGEKEQTED